MLFNGVPGFAKKALALGCAVVSMPAMSAVYFSEYIEGSSYNKALEIYSDAAIDLAASNVVVEYYSNGGNSVSASIALTGNIAAGDVHVLAHTSAAAAIKNEADQLSGSLQHNGDDAIVLKVNGSIVDSIGKIGEKKNWNRNGVSTKDQSLRRKQSVTAGDTNTGDDFFPDVEWDSTPKDTFTGIGNTDPVPVSEPLGNCGETSQGSFKLISAVQGNITDVSNDASPLQGQEVIVEGIVTADLQGGTLANGDSSYQYSGFWLQEETADSDGNAATSEGVFVYNYSNAVSEGDLVRLKAQVAEYKGVTQLSSVADLTVCSSGNALPAATVITLPLTALTDLEAVEGMLVESSQNLVVSDLFGTGYGFGNYGQFVVSSKLHFQPTEIALPESAEAQAAADARTLDYLLVDDGVSASYPSFIPFPDNTGFSALNPMRIGYTVPAFTGVLSGFEKSGKKNYTLVPKSINIVASHPRTSSPQVAADADLVVVGMNVLNYFNGNGDGTGFPTSRGAPTQAAFDMQRDKIVEALKAMDADIIGLMELENDGFGANSAIQDLVNALNAVQASGDEYSIVNPGVSMGTDAIAVGMIYRAGKVSLAGSAVVLNETNSPSDVDGVLFDTSKNRPALIQSFTNEGFTFTVAVNHLKSKGSSCGEPNEGDDGQGNCNIKRTRAAQGLVQFLNTDPTSASSDAYMILGDLNAYSKEDPMQVFYTAGYTNLKYTDKATETQPYSYTFSGYLGSLDHALATDSLKAKVVSVDAWHINSVEATMVDYLTEANGHPFDSVDNYANADAFRSSDHDPIVVGLKLKTSATPPPPPPTAGAVLPVFLLSLLGLLVYRRKQHG